MEKLFLKIAGLLTLLSTIQPLTGMGQPVFEDSLRNQIENINKELQTLIPDSTRFNLLLQLSKSYKGINRSAAEKYGLDALNLAREMRHKHAIARSCYNLGIIKKDLGKYVESNNLLNEGLKYYKKTNDKRGIAQTYNGLGNLSHELNDQEQALYFFNESVKQYALLKDETNVWRIMMNIGTYYLLDKENILKAQKLFSELIHNFQQKNKTEDLIAACLNLGEVFENLSNRDSAEYYYRKSLQLSELEGNPEDLMNSDYYYGKICFSFQRYDESIIFLLKALTLAKSLESKQKIVLIYKILSDNYAVKDDFQKAHFYLNEKDNTEEELKIQDASKIIARKKLDEQNRISKNRSYLIYFSLFCLFISLLLILAIYRNYLIKHKANRLLTEMDELKSKLFSNITHELRTPLTLILGPLEEMLVAGEKKNPKKHEIKMMRRNARRLLNLVNQMLDLAKLDAKKLKLELLEADFVRFFRIQISSFLSYAEQKGIHFSYSVPDEQLVTFFDSDKMEKIINNLLSNAFKFTNAGGEVKCGLEIVNRNKKTIRFFISDTGSGIPKEQIDKIFDRFHQIEGSVGIESVGTGIGLSLTKELVNLMHGEIKVKSEPGLGATFTVSVPLGFSHLDKEEYNLVIKLVPSGERISEKNDFIDTDEKNMEIPSGEIKHKVGLPVVLLVEDQEDIRDYIAERMRDSFSLLEAENGRKGFEMAVKSIPDLIITDLIMPEMDGVELCGKLKIDERTSHVPVIMLTARSDVSDRMAGIECGADTYMTKPFNTQEILLVARKLIEQRKKLRERFSRDIILEPREIAITSADEKFLNRALSVIESHMGDFEFEVSTFQKEMAMSRMQLFRKIKALTDQSPTEFIRIIRLKRAAKLIEQGFGNIAQISYEVGFNNPSYFAKCFKEVYGSLPSDYSKKQQKP